MPKPSFVQLPGDVNAWRCKLPWAISPVFVFLIEHETKSGFTLIDTGLPEHAEQLDNALAAVLGENGRILEVVVTHSHIDHAGNLQHILSVHPEAIAYVHALEVPLLDGSIRYRDLERDSGGRFCGISLFCILHRLILAETLVDFDGRLHAVTGSNYELKASGLRLFHAPGHTPGSQVAFDARSGSVYAGDAFMNLRGGGMPCTCCAGPRLSGPIPASTPRIAQARSTMCMLAKTLPDSWERLWPTHDDGEGVLRAEVEALATDLVCLPAMGDDSHQFVEQQQRV